MPVKVDCPVCSKELNAPDRLIGKTAACPQCGNQFTVPSCAAPQHLPMKDAGGATRPIFKSLPTTPPPPPPTQSPPNAATPSSPRALAQPPLPHGPALSSTGAHSPYPQPPAPPPSTATLTHPSPSQGAPPIANPPPSSTAAPTPPSSGIGQTPGQRRAKAAKFVTDGAVASRLILGADGQLPELVVAEGQKKAPAVESKKSVRPLVLIGVIGCSVALSVVMLFIPKETGQPVSRNKDDARQAIRDHYIGQTPPYKPYQQLLREALQDDNLGDAKSAREKYRRVLDMIHAEDRQGFLGLTGPKVSTVPPHDRDLESQLSILLREN